jgi:TrmH family RNA methyltransferase
MAHRAEDVLRDATLYTNLEESLATAALVIGTTSRRGSRWREVMEPEGLAAMLTEGWDWRPTALLFGPEDRGLSVRELSRCHGVVRIPTRPGCPSLNLSHAVALLCYVLTRWPFRNPERDTGSTISPEELQSFIRALERFMEGTAFLDPKAKRRRTAVQRLQRLLVRASPTRAEMGLLWALLRHLEGVKKPPPS